jgi:hypothetical protein
MSKSNVAFRWVLKLQRSNMSFIQRGECEQLHAQVALLRRL